MTSKSFQSRRGAVRGLDNLSVKQSRELHGENRITQKKHESFASKFLHNFGDPIIKILLIALGINIIIFFRNFDWYEPAGIAVAVLVATFISTISEHGSQSAFEKLQADASKISCKAWRDGALTELPVDEVVVGDWILLQSGDRVPADGIMIEGEITVDQSTLNGETKEVRKYPFEEDSTSFELRAPNTLFRSTVVCGGEGVMRVSTVGDKTFYGRLSQEVQEDTRESPMKVRLTQLADSISKIGYVGAGFVAFAFLFNRILFDNRFFLPAILNHISTPSLILTDIIEAITLAVVVIVVAVPEGLPMMITVVLSSNMKRMWKDNVLVRKMTGIETAGSLNILFSDKTGTLTTGRLSVAGFIDGSGKLYANTAELKAKRPLWSLFYQAMYYNNSSVLSWQNSIKKIVGGNSTDRALMSFCADNLERDIKLNRRSLLSFDSRKKYSAAVAENGRSLVKGAPDKLLGLCTSYYDEHGGLRPLSDVSHINAAISSLTAGAARVILVADCSYPVGEDTPLHSLNLIGLVAIRDKVRPEAVRGVATIRRAGVQVVMITGDGQDTALAVAKECGIVTRPDDAVITSDELARMSDSQVTELLPRLRVVARALPSDKSRLVTLAQQLDLVAGMTGDGVNDAPALKKADVGFAMGSGTEVAKEAGDVVILDDNFYSITKAVLYGRTIFKSIRKFIIFQLTVNLCAVGLSIISPFMGIDTPVTVMQMLWINMVMDTLAGLAFGGEPPLKEYMDEKPKKRSEKIINKYMLGEIFFTGSFATIMCLVFLKSPVIAACFRHDTAGKYLMSGFFSLFVFSAIFNSLNARTHRLNLFAHLGRNKSFIFVMGIVTVVQLLLLYYGGTLFRTAPLLPSELILSAALAFLVVPVDFLRKIVMRRVFGNEGV